MKSKRNRSYAEDLYEKAKSALFNLAYDWGHDPDLRDVLRNLAGYWWNTEQKLGELETSPATQSFRLAVLQDARETLMTSFSPETADALQKNADAQEDFAKMDAAFTDNPYKKRWHTLQQTCETILSSAGMTVPKEAWRPYAIADVLADAVSFYEHNQAYQLTDGAPHTTCQVPDIDPNLTVYPSEKAFLNALLQDRKDTSNVIMLGAVAASIDHDCPVDFYHEIYGKDLPCLIKAQTDGQKTREEARSTIIRRQIYLGIRKDSQCFFVPIPMHHTYDVIDRSGTVCTNDRNSFAPYQIFFSSDTKTLSKPSAQYRLADILDNRQKIWFAILIRQTIRRFFHICPRVQRGFLSGCTISDQPDNTLFDPQIIPFDTEAAWKTCQDQWTDEIKTAVEHFLPFEQNATDVLRPYLPLYFPGILTYKQMQEMLNRMLTEILYARTAQKILQWHTEYMKIGKDRKAFAKWAQEEKDTICARAKEGAFLSFGTLTDRIPHENNQTPEPLQISDGAQNPNVETPGTPVVLWAGNADPQKRPDYIYRIIPKTAEEFAALFSLRSYMVPDSIIRWYAMRTFCKMYQNRRYSISNPSLFPDPIIIHICMDADERAYWCMEDRPDDRVPTI